MVTTQALEQVTNASYQRELLQQNKTLSVLTADEYDLMLSAKIAATSKDELFAWIRANYFVIPLDAVPNILYWYVIKAKSGDAVPDLTDSAVLEDLQKTGKIFARGTLATPMPSLGYAPKKLPEIEFHNVKLKAGEELRLLVMAFFAMNTNGISLYGDLEYRQVGV